MSLDDSDFAMFQTGLFNLFDSITKDDGLNDQIALVRLCITEELCDSIHSSAQHVAEAINNLADAIREMKQ
jgi:hypothetical protein